MRVTAAVDSFKGSLTSMEAGEAVKNGILRVYPDASVTVRPLADGGEGTAYALTTGMGGKWISLEATGPLGNRIPVNYGILAETKTAILEMSAAAGLTLVPDGQKNPLHTTTYGVGEMIVDAIRRGCRKFIVGIGGSSTNDGGIGMLQALGFDLLNEAQEPVSFGAMGLAQLKSIGTEHVLPELAECTFRIACDVTNPLCGTLGCSAVFGPQKGASPEMIRDMDQWLSAFASLAKKTFPQADASYPGTGAAGGLGFAFSTFTNAVLESGIKIVLEETCLRDYVKHADFVITGEGRLDRQTVMGKAPIGVARAAKAFDKPVLAFCGSAAGDAGACNDAGIDAFFPILRSITTLSEAMKKETAASNMADAVEQVFRMIKASRQD